MEDRNIQNIDDVIHWYEVEKGKIDNIAQAITDLKNECVQMKFIQRDTTQPYTPAYGNEKEGMGWFILLE